MPESVPGDPHGEAQTSLSELAQQVASGVEDMSAELRGWEERWNDPDALRRRLRELTKNSSAVAQVLLLAGGQALSARLGAFSIPLDWQHTLASLAAATAPVSPWW